MPFPSSRAPAHLPASNSLRELSGMAYLGEEQHLAMAMLNEQHQLHNLTIPYSNTPQILNLSDPIPLLASRSSHRSLRSSPTPTGSTPRLSSSSFNPPLCFALIFLPFHAAPPSSPPSSPPLSTITSSALLYFFLFFLVAPPLLSPLHRLTAAAPPPHRPVRPAPSIGINLHTLILVEQAPLPYPASSPSVSPPTIKIDATPSIQPPSAKSEANPPAVGSPSSSSTL